MLVNAFLSFLFWSFLAVIGTVALIQRRRAKRRKSKFVFYPSAVLLASAFQQLQSIAQPRVQHVIEERMDEDADDEESGGPDTAKRARRHLLRQAERIRRGQELEHLTALLDSPNSKSPGK